MKRLTLPDKDKGSITIDSEHTFVIVGANGSGKSRLGAWIETNNVNAVHRVSAQRSLVIPDFVSLKSFEQSYNELFFGNATEKNKGYRWEWGKYTTKMLNDYDYVLSTLFAKQSKLHEEFINECKVKEFQGVSYNKAPLSDIDRILEIWGDVFPQRKIFLKDAKVSAQLNGNDYHGKELSDGERVAIYLLGQCLSAESGCTLVVDEPELHLHKSIMHRLWDKIEEYCQDKTIVYITHDLDFASSRKESPKIWVHEFDGINWKLDLLPEVDEIPDNLLIEILGNRKDVLFIEGEKGSYDFPIYSHLYKNFFVVPRGGCAKVIESTKALSSLNNLHHLQVHGIIDKDFRTDEEIEALSKNNISVLNVAEIENLLCIEGVIGVVSEHLGLDKNNVIQSVKNFVLEEFTKEYDYQLAEACEGEIKFRLNCYKRQNNTKEGLKEGLKTLIEGIDDEKIYNDCKARVDKMLSKNDLNSILSIYNRKNIHKRIAPYFGLKEGEYINLVIRLLKTKKKEELVYELSKVVPPLK